MKNWTIKNDGSEDFRNIVIPYLSHRFGKEIIGLANWYSVINGELVISEERPIFNVLGIDGFIRSIIYPREFKKGEKVVVRGRKKGFKFVKHDLADKPSIKVILVKNNAEKFWVSQFDVFQMPQKAKKKKKKKFKNGEKVVIYKGRTDETVACYIGKNPVERKGIHIVLIDGKIGTNNVHESFMKKIK